MGVETICNQAIDLLGYARHIGNIYEGSVAARAFLDTYVETRNALLEHLMPDWARKDAIMTLLKSAPNIINGTADYGPGWNNTYPPIPWLYEYAYPDDCIVGLQVKTPVLSVPIWRPRFNPMRTPFKTSGFSHRSVLTNVPDAILIYIAVVDNPDHWESDFTELMIAALAKKVEPVLMPQRTQQRRQQQQQEPRNADSAG